MMRNTECYRLVKVLLPHLPGFATNRKSELFIAPIGDVLRGFTFESSAHSREDFYFTWFFMPICQPIEYLTLSFGGRLNVPGGNVGWRTDMADLAEKLFVAMRPKALPLLRSINSISDTIEAIYGHAGTKQITDINVQDDLACLTILDGRLDEARKMLDKIVAHEHGQDQRQWVLDIVDRMKNLRAKLLEDPQLAVTQVKRWQDYTFKALKLEKWR